MEEIKKKGGEGRRRTVSSHAERERERLVHRLILHSLLFTLLFLEDRSTEFRPRKAKKIDHRSCFLPSVTLASFILTTDGKENIIIMHEYGGRGGWASSQQKTRTSHHLPPLAPRTDKLDSSSSTHLRPSGLTATSTSSSTSAGSSRATRLSHRSRAGCWTCRGRKVGRYLSGVTFTMFADFFMLTNFNR